MLNVAGYSPLDSATGLFWINITMLFAFMFWGYILPKFSSLGIDSIKIVKIGLPISYVVLFSIIIMGQNAGAIMFTLYILSSIVLSLTQPALALSFPQNLAGKSLTSINVFIHSGTFFVQWGIGLLIDLSKNMGASIVTSYKISFSIFLILCIFSYLFFIYFMDGFIHIFMLFIFFPSILFFNVKLHSFFIATMNRSFGYRYIF